MKTTGDIVDEQNHRRIFEKQGILNSDQAKLDPGVAGDPINRRKRSWARLPLSSVPQLPYVQTVHLCV